MDSGCSKLLIVDASVVAVDLLSYWLRAEDIQIFTAESGLHTMAKLAFIRPDIVVVNVELPDMSGFDLCKTIKQESEEILILCISSMENENNRLHAEEVGADDYFEATAGHYLFISKVRSLLQVRRLSKQLRQQYAELEKRDALINKQLEMGMQVQRALIPEINMQFNSCELRSRYYPAMGLGGDFYNVMKLSSDSFGIVMGDVSGHGIASAFVTALLNVMIKYFAMTHPEPDQLLHRLNNELYGLFENSEHTIYACVFYALVNTSEQVVRYANAGLCLPFNVDTKNDIVTELDITGHPIGMMKDTVYDIKEVKYSPSDLLLFYTDGLQDSAYKNQTDEFTRHMKEVLSDIRLHNNMEAMLDIICDNFYRTPESGTKRMETDDVSMILCRL